MLALLKAVSWVTGPYQLAALLCATLAYSCRPLFKDRKSARFAMTTLAITLYAICLSGFAESTYLKSRGLYHIRVVVLGTDGQPTDQAVVTSSAGGEMKEGNSNWEFDLPPQSKPSNGKITIFASLKDAFLSGNSTLDLKDDYYPSVTVQLAPLPEATIHGVVVDESGRSVKGARVSVLGFPDISTSDEMGNFSLPSHHAEGQLISIRAEKGKEVAETSVIAGKGAQIVLRKR